jgi:hypothetical protein
MAGNHELHLQVLVAIPHSRARPRRGGRSSAKFCEAGVNSCSPQANIKTAILQGYSASDSEESSSRHG